MSSLAKRLALCWLDAATLMGRTRGHLGVFFISIFFKKNYKNIFSISHFIFLYPYRPAGGGRDLYVNKYKFYLRRGPWRGPAAPLPGGRPPAARQGAAGSRQGYKSSAPSLASSFSAHEIQRVEREIGGVREVIPPAINP